MKLFQHKVTMLRKQQIMKKCYLFCVLWIMLVRSAGSTSPEMYNPAWDSQSETVSGSVPVGGEDIFAAVPSAALEGSPNFVFIFIDDMGYGDIGPFGSTRNKTPNLDRMAKEGIRLTQFYVSNTACTPSRAALLTGTYASRIGMDGDVCLAGDARGLNPNEITIADVLKTKGYATGCFGKWHLGDQPEFLPLKQGFDEFAGIPYSNDIWPHHSKQHRYKFPPLPFMEGYQAVAYIPDGKNQSVLCGAVTDAVVDFIKRKCDEPFFIYLPYSAIHQPRFTPKEWAERAGGDLTRAQIEELDHYVGRIMKTLEELDLAKNTLVMFTSDNGGSGGTSMGPLRGWKGGAAYEGHMRMPTIAWWPGTIPAGSVTSEIGNTVDILPTFAGLAGAEFPRDIDGKDISGLLLAKENAKSPHKVLFYETGGVRQGKWKLVRNQQHYELYDLDVDIGEQHNLAEKFPDRVTELEALLDAHARDLQKRNRPAALVENPKPILTSGDGLPTLVEYLGLADVKWSGSYKPIISDGHR